MAEAASGFGEVYVAAPDMEQSRVGHAIAIAQPVQAYEGVVVEGEDPLDRPLYWFAARPLKEAEEGTDRWAVEQGFIAANPLRLDLTDEARPQPALAHD
nr:hypothetical protein [Thermus caldifontis]